MCTVTFGIKDGATVVTVNRDESRFRVGELAPKILGIKIYPLDKISGGTWCGANAEGLVLSLLNRYDETEEHPHASRGVIIPQLLEEKTIEGAGEVLEKLNKSIRYAPYTLLAIQGNEAKHWEWDGDKLKSEDLKPIDEGWQCLSSSSYKTEEVLAWRYELFKDWLRDQTFSGTVPTFNRLQPEGKEDFAPLVEREKTITTSITQFTLTDKLEVSYWDINHLLNNDPSLQLELPLT